MKRRCTGHRRLRIVPLQRQIKRSLLAVGRSKICGPQGRQGIVTRKGQVVEKTTEPADIQIKGQCQAIPL
jgi:hypothetical protein